MTTETEFAHNLDSSRLALLMRTDQAPRRDLTLQDVLRGEMDGHASRLGPLERLDGEILALRERLAEPARAGDDAADLREALAFFEACRLKLLAERDSATQPAAALGAGRRGG